MQPHEVALAHAAERLKFARAAAAIAAQRWAAIDQAHLAASWLDALPQLALMVTGAQFAAAKAADPYVTSALEAQGIDAAATAVVEPAMLAGIASDGRDLMSLLYQPVIATLSAIQAGATLPRALATGSASLHMIVRTQVADAGRVADQVSTVTRPHVDGYVRVIVGATCSRCVVLAGRHYQWNAGFDRHLRCDCIGLPAPQAALAGFNQDPKVIYDSLTTEERQRAGWSLGDQKAIDAGADLNQVTNAKRGLFKAGGEKLTTTGTTRHALFGGHDINPETGTFTPRPKGSAPKESRLMPETIFKQAKGDRREALRLLRENGYIKPEVVNGRFSLPPLPAKVSAKVPAAVAHVPAKAAPVVKAMPVPEFAKPYHRSMDGLEDLARAVEAGGFTAETALTGGFAAETSLVTLADGRKLVRKASGNSTAEQAASMIGRALGVRTPRVYRNHPGEVWMDYIDDAKTWDQLRLLRADPARIQSALESDDGKLVGLLDLMISNGDRNTGNWMLNDSGHVFAIDHGFTFEIPMRGPLRVGPRGPFSESWLDATQKQFAANDLTRADVDELRRRLQALRPDFDLLDQPRWLQYALSVLDAIEPHARGTRNLIAGVQ